LSLATAVQYVWAMKSVSLKRFLKLRAALQLEKAALMIRLQEINTTLYRPISENSPSLARRLKKQ
jgi:hypothetical protein